MNEMLPPDVDSDAEYDPMPAVPANRTDIREISVLELLTALRVSPRETWQAFWRVVSEDRVTAPVTLPVQAQRVQNDGVKQDLSSRLRALAGISDPAQVMMRVAAILIALSGNLILSATPDVRRSEAVELAQGAPFLMIGFVLWLLADFLMLRRALTDWWQQQQLVERLFVGARLLVTALIAVSIAILWGATQFSPEEVVGQIIPAIQLFVMGALLWFVLDALPLLLRRRTVVPTEESTEDVAEVDVTPLFMRVHPLRLVLAAGGMFASIATWFGTANNTMPDVIFYVWMASVGLWSLAFAPEHWNPIEWAQRRWLQVQRFEWRSYLGVLAVAGVLIAVGMWFRFYQLDTHPLEMTDDHVEKILDAGLVRDGARPIFFANNGGREPFQMYAIALASYLPGLGIDHYTIKFVAVIESLITLPILFWLGYELLQGESQRRRLLMGLLLMGLVAVSYWHVAVTRLGLRIVLTPLVSALLLIYLMRAMRRNQRADFIKAGLVLGFGLYMYQAVRMLPVVIVVAIALAIYLTARSWRERMRYVLNLMVLVWVSLIVFIPMLHYSVEYPDLFWRRTAGRLLGDDVIEETLADGTIAMRDPTVEERVNAFRDNLPVLVSNVRNVLLMFNWKGDVGAINGVSNRPAMDSYSGALLIVGCAAWLVLVIRRRDAVYGLIPLFVLIMLLPSALSIAFPVENPSHTRTSGALPAVYILAAYPLALLADYMWQQAASRRGRVLAAAGCSLLLLGSFSANRYTYLDLYPTMYTNSFHPYTVPGDYLRGFVLTGGSYGNAFMIGYPHWWSHRAIGLAAGLEERWPNGIVNRTDIPAFLRDAAQRTDRFRFDPQRDMLFFFSPADVETADYLTAQFPTGYVREEPTYKRGESYMVFRVPAPGVDAFNAWLATQP